MLQTENGAKNAPQASADSQIARRFSSSDNSPSKDCRGLSSDFLKLCKRNPCKSRTLFAFALSFGRDFPPYRRNPTFPPWYSLAEWRRSSDRTNACRMHNVLCDCSWRCMTALCFPPTLGFPFSMLKFTIHCPRMRSAVRLFRAFSRLGLAQRRETHFLLAADAAHIFDSVRCHDE